MKRADDLPLPVWSRPRPTRAQACIVFLKLAAASCFMMLVLTAIAPYAFPRDRYPDDVVGGGVDGPQTRGKALVPLEAHIMSKCEDARDCLRDMILPVMQRTFDKVNFTLSFIGQPTQNDGVDCKHGPEECMGNILELCAFEHYPDPKISLGFTMCITRDYDLIPERELIEECALEHAVEFQALNECATEENGAHGMDMLRHSVERTSEVR